MSRSLRHIQNVLTEGLLHQSNEGLLGLFKNQGADFQSRISVYRNNVFYSLSKALADLYPVVQQLVGEEFFQALAKRYIRAHPPSQPAMVYFAEDFPEFVQTDRACKPLFYLADVARFELARQRAYHAADIEPLTPQAMQESGVERLMTGRLILHPSLQMLDSQWATRSIWLEHQREQPQFEGIELHHSEQSILIRPQYEVQVCRVDAATLMLVGKIAESIDLQTAIEDTVEHFPDFDLAAALALGFSRGFFTDIELSPE